MQTVLVVAFVSLALLATPLAAAPRSASPPPTCEAGCDQHIPSPLQSVVGKKHALSQGRVAGPAHRLVVAL